MTPVSIGDDVKLVDYFLTLILLNSDNSYPTQILSAPSPTSCSLPLHGNTSSTSNCNQLSNITLLQNSPLEAQQDHFSQNPAQIINPPESHNPLELQGEHDHIMPGQSSGISPASQNCRLGLAIPLSSLTTSEPMSEGYYGFLQNAASVFWESQMSSVPVTERANPNINNSSITASSAFQRPCVPQPLIPHSEIPLDFSFHDISDITTWELGNNILSGANSTNHSGFDVPSSSSGYTSQDV
jgi:hypothetical protein